MAGPNEGPAPVDIGAQLFARGVGGGQNNAETPLDVNGASDVFDLFKEGANKLAGNTAKLLQGIPIIGGLLASLIPTNAGQVGIFSSMDSQGFAAKPMMQTSGGPKGGVLAQIAFGEVLKNKGITDHTGNVGGAQVERMQWQEMSMASLGNISPSSGGGGINMDAGMAMG